MRKTILALVVCVLSLSSSAQVSGQVAADASRYLRVLPSGNAAGPAFRVSSGTTDAAAKTAHPDEKARWQVVEDRPSGNVLIIRGAQATQGELMRTPSRGPAGTDRGVTERLPRQVPAATVNRAVSTIPEFELSEPVESSAPAELRGTAAQIRRIAADHPRDNAAAVQAAGETLVLGPVAAADREQPPAAACGRDRWKRRHIAAAGMEICARSECGAAGRDVSADSEQGYAVGSRSAGGSRGSGGMSDSGLRAGGSDSGADNAMETWHAGGG